MSDLDPARAASLDDLARFLRQLHLRADMPSFRSLENRTKHANGLLPGTRIERVPLRRSTLSDVLQGQMFPRKSFLLTFVEACGVDLEVDRRWGQAWDRLANQAQDQDRDQLQYEFDELGPPLAEAEDRARAADNRAEAGMAVSPVSARYPVIRVGDNEALIFTMRELNQQTARIMSEIENSGKPAIISRHGRFVAIIMPLAPGQVESRILPEIARQIGKRGGV